MSLDLARHMTRREWGRARKMFEGGAAFADIAKRFAIQSVTIRHMARREGWAIPLGVDDAKGKRGPIGDDLLVREDSPSGSRSTNKEPPTDAQRDVQSQRTLKRFARDKSKPEELETLRLNLIVARVMSGMTAVEAAERFGYANSTQLSLIESGQRKIPDDRQFLVQAARVYAVSLDFLVGLSPHMECDARVVRQHALMRGTESILGSIAAEFATVMIQFTNQTLPVREDFDRVSNAAHSVELALCMARKHGLDEIRGSSALLVAVERLAKAVEPLRQKVMCYRSIDSYFDEQRAGRMPPIAYLTERFASDEDFGEGLA